MKKTTKTLFSLLLVLTMVFQFAAFAPSARADVSGTATVELKLNVTGGDYYDEAKGGAVEKADDIDALVSLSDHDTASDLLAGLTISPASGYAVTSVIIVKAQGMGDDMKDLLQYAEATADEDDGAAITISSDDIVFNGEGDSYELWIVLSPLTAVAAKAPTCTEAGNSAYYVIDGNYYSDEACLDSLDEIPTLAATGVHTLVKVDAKDATAEADGNIEYWKCSECDKYFSDAEGQTEITDKDSVVTKYQAPAPTTCTVTFDANGHGTAPAAQTVNSGDKAAEPTAPTADGFTFGGWFTEAACTNAFSFDTAVSADVTVYAKWTEDSPAPTTYTLSFDANGGTGTMDAITVTAGEEYTVPECGFTAPDGKEFSRWMRGDLPLQPGAKDTLTGDNALVAEWKDASSGSDTPADTHTHSLKKVEAKAATSVDDGNIEYWVCEDASCGKFFSDAEGKTEITDKSSVVVKATGKPLTEGTDTAWEQDSKEGLAIHIDATFDSTLQDTLIVKIGETVVPKDKYTVTAGSVIVTIDPAYLATLPAGTHTIDITFPSGNTVSSTVTIAAAAPGTTALSFAVDAAGCTKVYDGLSFDLNALKNYITLVNLPAGYTADVEISYEGGVPDFYTYGSVTVKLHLAGVKDGSGTDVTAAFTCEDKTGVPLTITQRKITVETRDDSKVYDGKAWTYTHMSNAQPIMTYTDPKLGEYTRNGVTYVQQISIKYTASPKNMGTYDNTAELIIREKVKGSSEAGTDVTANYAITYKYGKIKITDSKGNVPASSVPVTGDANNIWLWVGLMAAAVILVVVILLVARKSKKGGKAPSSGVSE